MEAIEDKVKSLRKAEKIVASIASMREDTYNSLLEDIENMVLMGPNTNPVFVTQHDIHVFYYQLKKKNSNFFGLPKFSIHKIVKSVFPDSIGDIWIGYSTGGTSHKPSLEQLITFHSIIKALYNELNAPGEIKIKVISNLSHYDWY